MPFASSFFVLVIFALGYPLARMFRLRWSFQMLGITFGLGLQVGLTCGLLAPSIHGLTQLWAFMLLPCLFFLYRDLKRHAALLGRGIDTVGAVLIGFTILGIFMKVMADPIQQWDARSIWFFHAKILFHADHMLDTKLWATPSIAWSHVDYPKLNAFWAAAWMTRFAGWNEYLPKFSLVLLWIPAIFLSVGFSRALVPRLFLLTFLVLKAQELIWNGYMDGLLACYAGLGLLHGIRFVKKGGLVDLYATIVTVGLCCGIKNEGTALAFIILALVLAGRWYERHRCKMPAWTFHTLFTAPTVGVVIGTFSSCLIWSGWKFVADISNDLVSASGPLQRLSVRVVDHHSLTNIWQGLFSQDDTDVLKLLSVAALVYGALNLRRFRPSVASLLPAMGVGVGYLIVLLVVFLTTPYDLQWHLSTSADRVRLTLHACLAVGMIGWIMDDDANVDTCIN